MIDRKFIGTVLPTNWVPQTALRGCNVRFSGTTRAADTVTCPGKIVERYERDGAKLVRVEIQATEQSGEVKTTGEALVALA